MPDEMKHQVVLRTLRIIPKLPLFSLAGRWNVHVHERYNLQSASRLRHRSRDSQDKQSCLARRRFKNLSVTRPGLTGPERDRNTCWGFFPLVPVGSPLHPLLTAASGPLTVTSLTLITSYQPFSSAQSHASVPLSCSLLMSPLTYIWTCLISYEGAECLAEGREGGKTEESKRQIEKEQVCVWETKRQIENPWGCKSGVVRLLTTLPLASA